MAKSNAEKLMEAIAAGDLEAIASLAPKVVPQKKAAPKKGKQAPKKATPKKAPPKKSSPNPTSRVDAPPAPPTEPVGPVLTGDVRPDVIDLEDYLRNGGKKGPASSSTIFVPDNILAGDRRPGANGGTGRQMRRESAQGVGRGTKFITPQGPVDGRISGIAGKVDAANGQHDVELDRREPAQLIRARCKSCGRQDNIYQSQLSYSYDDEGKHRDWFYVCNSCTRGR